MKASGKQQMLIAYAADFVSYVLTEKRIDFKEIRNILLYGSAARGDLTEASDIDIFLDAVKPTKEMERLVKEASTQFLTSIWHAKWRRLGIKNSINCLVGNLDEWKELKNSIIMSNVVLFGRYRKDMEGKAMMLFSIKGMKPEAKRIFVLRKLFGYNRYGKHYSGLLERYEGQKLGKGTFAVPSEHAPDVLAFLRKQKVNAEVRDITLAE